MHATKASIGQRAHPLTGTFLEGRLRHDLSEREKDMLEGLVAEVIELEGDHRLIAAGDMPGHSTMLIDGFMLRTLENHNSRHAVSCHVPGDFVDLHCFALKKLDHNIDCVGRAKVGLVPHERLREIMDHEPHLAHVLWFSTLLDAAIHREWIMKLEQLQAPQRIAHIVCEIWHRLDMVGRARPDGFDTPLRQSDLGEMIGASAVHTNRALMELKQAGLMSFAHNRVQFGNRTALEAYATFDTGYLYKNSGISLSVDGMGGG